MRGARVMLVVDPRIDGVLDAVGRLRREVAGETIAVQLRMKGASDPERLIASRRLAEVLPVDATIVVNESIAVARAIAADGVHLPEAAGTVGDARALLPAGALVGCSCHGAEGVVRRVGEGADYLVLGPLGDVPGKPAMAPAAFREAASRASVRVFALGGISTRDDVRRARELGASGVAIQRALLTPGVGALIRAAAEVLAR